MSTIKKLTLSALIIPLMLMALMPCLHGQVATGRVSGTIQDTSGAVVANARISITNQSTSISQSVNSGSSGAYFFEAVNPGTYTLTVEASGFERHISRGVQVHLQQNTSIDVTLAIGNTSQSVMVTAAAPLMQTQDASLGQTIDEEAVNDMPMASRDWESLANLAAGATTSAGGAAGDTFFMVNGNNYTQNDFRLDGIDNNVEVFGGNGFFGHMGAITPPPDAIQEFKVQTGDFSAEFGHSTGAVENAVIKSGTNSIHGNLWEYVRNTAFNANDYFAKQDGVARTPYHQNQFGGTIGGPVYIPKLYDGKNKTFFFFDYQGTRISTPAPIISSVPTAGMRNSNFTNFQDFFAVSGGTKTDALGRVFPLATFMDPATTRWVAAGAVDPISGLTNSGGSAVAVRDPFYSGAGISGIRDFTGLTQYLNQLPANRIDPNAQKILALYPAPNITQAWPNNYYMNQAYRNTVNQYDVRIDENISSKDILFGVLSVDKNSVTQPPALPGYAEGQGFGDGTQGGPRYAISLGYTHIFSPTLTNEFHAGRIHSIEHLGGPFPNEMGIPEQFGIQGVPQVPGNGGLPAINLAGLAPLGAAGWMPTLQTVTTLELMDNVTKIYGAHALKTGYQIDVNHAPIIQPTWAKGEFTFNGGFSDVPNFSSGFTGASDMLLVPTTSSVAGGINNLGGLANYAMSNWATVHDQRTFMGAYVQDDWKVSGKLTLNLGVRWDLFEPYTEGKGRAANFVELPNQGFGGTYYIPKRTCNSVPMSQDFLNQLQAYNISLNCTSNNHLGNPQFSNFSPRVGFAYSINPRLVVRGGYGIAYGALNNHGFGGDIGNNYPFLYTVGYNAPTSQTPLVLANGQTAVLENALVAQNLQSPSVVPAAGLGLNGRTWNYKTPLTETANLTLQYQLTSHDTASAGWVSTSGRHGDSNTPQNAPSAMLPPGTNYYDPTVQGHIPFPNFSPSSTFETTDGISNYEALQTIYQHQMSAGLTLLANYTYAKCLTDQNAYQGNTGVGYRAASLPGFGKRQDYALCVADATHVIHGSGTYKIPVGRGKTLLHDTNRLTDAFVGGWVTNFIVSRQSGQPFTVGCPVATTADFGCYANLVQGQNAYAGPHDATQWLNPAAFSNPPVATTIGQTDVAPLGSRGSQVRGPAFTNLDMSVFKEISIKEKSRFEFRAEAFNLPNSHAWANPGQLNFLNPVNFSKITSSRSNPRILQLALKLYY